MIKIVCSGKIKENYLSELIQDYLGRINKYHKIEVIELKDENDLAKEAVGIQKNIGPRDYCIACTIDGQKMSSIELAHTIDRAFQKSGTLTFVIGSSEGLADSIVDRADLCLSFSDLTMPHGLFRGVLLEQIYRSFKINNNETYHK